MKFVVRNLESKALASHGMSQPFTSRENSSELFSEPVLRSAQFRGFRPRDPMKSKLKATLQSSETELTESLPQGPLGAEVGENFVLSTQQKILFSVNNILGLFSLSQKGCAQRNRERVPQASLSGIWNAQRTQNSVNVVSYSVRRTECGARNSD